jgi:hypothetical protein
MSPNPVSTERGQGHTKFGEAMGVDDPTWLLQTSAKAHEAGYLLLDSTKARSILEWKDRLDFDSTIKQLIGLQIGIKMPWILMYGQLQRGKLADSCQLPTSFPVSLIGYTSCALNQLKLYSSHCIDLDNWDI